MKLESFEKRAEKVLDTAYYGLHHCPEIKKVAADRWEVNNYGMLATADSDILTRLVISAHDQCIRVQIQSSGPRLVKIVLSPRHGRIGPFSEIHPTIEQAIEKIRKAGHQPIESCSTPPTA